jgi:hypothetical protein
MANSAVPQVDFSEAEQESADQDAPVFRLE